MLKATKVCYIQIYVHLIIYLNLHGLCGLYVIVSYHCTVVLIVCILDYSIVSLDRELKLALTIYIF